MKRIYHPYWVWEDYKHGFYDNCSGSVKDKHIEKGIEMFNSKKLTEENMFFVVDNWKYSCEHNLTNPSINKIAYIGQSACCVYAGIPSTVTMELWNMLDKKTQEQANAIAIKTIDRWVTNNKFIQLCLNID
jgi:protoheme ferro-lyase